MTQISGCTSGGTPSLHFLRTVFPVKTQQSGLTPIEHEVRILNLCFATFEERAMRLPGDELIELPNIRSTHAVTLRVSASRVWPWVVQIGQARGGFYSYTFLENLLGCKMKNADCIHPEWQQLTLDQEIKLHPKFPPMRVQEWEPERSLVLRQQTRFDWTWSFTLVPHNASECRLLVRSRILSKRWLLTILLYPVMTWGHYFMERKMLLGIKRRSENTVARM